MKIESFDDACPDGWDPVFERVWKGIEEGCRIDYKVNTGKKYSSGVEMVGIATTYSMENFDKGYDVQCREPISAVDPIS